MKKRNSARKNTKSKQRKVTRKKAPGLPFWRQPVLWGFLLALFAFMTMVMYGRLPSPESPPLSVQLNEAEVLSDVRVEVESLLWRLGFETNTVSQEPSEGVLDLRLQGDFPQRDALQSFEVRLEEISPELRFERYSPAQELRVFNGPALIARLRFASEPEVVVHQGPTVTIIMDDVGRSLSKVRRLLSLEQPVTLAILPSTPYAADAAELAHQKGREIMVHIPMEPQGYPAIEPGRDALLLQHDSWEVKRRLEDMFKRVPYAVGGNNHMGSRYTEYAEGMQVVSEFFKERDLLFVDSRTTGKTIAEQTMDRQGVPVVSRDVFLDNQQDVESIRAQIQHLISQAQRYGLAVGICHPYEETLTALEMELPGLPDAGVNIVSVKEMIGLVQTRGN